MTGEFNRAPRPSTTGAGYLVGDVVEANGHRWIVRGIHPAGMVILAASDAAIRWTTTLALLLSKGTK